MSAVIKKILLAEDDEQGVVPAELFFDPDLWDEDEGELPTLLVARTVEEFEEIVKREGPSLDAVVTDVVLKEGGPQSGVDVYTRLREFIPEVPCIVITGYAHETEAVKAVKAGIVDYIRKPFSWDDLWRLLKDKIAISQLNRHMRAFQSALSEITRFLRDLEQLNTPDLSRQLLQRLVEVAVLATEADGGWVMLADRDQLAVSHTVGFPEPGPLEPDQAGLFRSVYITQMEQCVAFQGGEDPSRLAPFERDRDAVLAVPLLSESDCLGVLEVAREKGKGFFSARHVSILAQFAGLAAVTVETYRRDLDASNLLLRALKRGIDQESKDGPSDEVDSAFRDLAREARSLEGTGTGGDPELHDLLGSLAAIREAGDHHLAFWRDSLSRYQAVLEQS